MTAVPSIMAIRTPRLSQVAVCAISAGYLAALVLLFLRHGWIVDAAGRPIVTDFLEVWTAGRFALEGHALSAYDWRIHHAAQAVLAGRDFGGYLFWSYPPIFLFAAALLASLPYAFAFAGWVTATAAAFALAAKSITRSWFGAAAACAMPVFLANAITGQNGLLTAALMGSALLLLGKRPLLSGVLFGVLTYKPQLGILIPLWLVLEGQWRTIASAIVATVALVVVSSFAFGLGAWRAFFHFLPATSASILSGGGEDWHKMQSVYALARMLDAGDIVAWCAQGVTFALCVVFVVLLKRSRVSYGVRAAGLVAASMLAIPYLHMYDFALLMVPFAFLHRERAFDRIEAAGIIFANLLFAGFAFYEMPIGVAIVAIVMALIFRRALKTSTGALGFLPGRSGQLSPNDAINFDLAR